MKHSDYIELIPELKEWEAHNGHPFTPDEWICGIGNFEHAIGYLSIFWPELYEYDGCIFVSSMPDRDNYQSWIKETKNDKKSVEAVLNHVHIIDLFQVGQLEPTKMQIEYIGNKLKEMWLAKSKAECPGRNISVEFYEGNESDLVEYQVTLFQNEHKS